MPSSRPNIIPNVLHLVRQLKPASILDVGVGFGKWGHLFREYTDILEAEHDPARYQKENWRVRIDGIEAHAPYLSPMHLYLYDTIHLGDAATLMRTLPKYDLVFLGDIIEHFDKPAGLQLLRESFAHANKAVVVSTPKYETAQADLCGNELERHRSLWSARDFRIVPGAQVRTIAQSTLLAVLPQPGLPKLELVPPRQRQQDFVQVQRVRAELEALLSPETPFILVDEEQIRGSLGWKRVIPFLEKDGAYWGLPADDAHAIRELERLGSTGAEYVVFIPSTFWWLDHYALFQQHLRKNYVSVRENDRLIVFRLSAPVGRVSNPSHSSPLSAPSSPPANDL